MRLFTEMGGTVRLNARVKELLVEDGAARGVKVITLPEERWAHPHIKTLQLLPNVMALPPGPAVGHVAISVRDFGCGIAPENLPRVFEPFFTTKALSTRRGTGLGLSIAYELAKKMEAGLAVESAPGKGSVFSLILPVAPAAKPLTAASS